MSNSPDLIQRVVDAHRALAILRLLDAELRLCANDLILAECLGVMGLRCAREALRGQLDFLAREGLVTLDQRKSLLVVELSRHGAEVAQGLVAVDGVAMPGPECPY